MEARSPIPPLLVAEGYDLTFFRSQRELGVYLEPWFADEEYRAWDGLGRPLELVVVHPPDSPPTGFLKRRRHGHAHIEARLSERTQKTRACDDCATYLREWLSKVGGPELSPNASLSDLLVQALLRGDIH
jgi:hypothetical protein